MCADRAAIAANRFGLGAQPGELSALGSDAPGALKAQLRGPPPLLRDAALKSSAEILAGSAELLRERREQRQMAQQQSADGNAVAVNFMALGQYLRPLYVADAQARLRAAAATPRAFAERLVHFWSNHFAVSVDKLAVLGVAGSFEREAIRPHVLGRFQDLLLAVEQHPAMLLYLDNQQSIGPNSVLARRAAGRGRTLGLNENLAREILELHTLGVDAGYTQSDVTSFAKVLTGWSLGGGNGALRSGTPGQFQFRPLLHEPGAQHVFGRRYAEDGQDQGLAVLGDLARAPATAHHVATKLVRHFVADDPPAAAVERVARAFERSDGELPHVYEALIDSPEAWDAAAQKFKTPQDYIFSVHRGLALPVEDGPRALASFELLGQRQFAPGSPAGWPDRSADWDGASALMKRIELASAVAQKLGGQRDAMELAPQLLGCARSEATRSAIAHAASAAQALTLLLVAPEFIRR